MQSPTLLLFPTGESEESIRQHREQMLKRDGWRCQHCGRPTGLQVHHIKPPGRLGDDAEQNLITLCAQCHQELHP